MCYEAVTYLWMINCQFYLIFPKLWGKEPKQVKIWSAAPLTKVSSLYFHNLGPFYYYYLIKMNSLSASLFECMTENRSV